MAKNTKSGKGSSKSSAKAAKTTKAAKAEKATKSSSAKSSSKTSSNKQIKGAKKIAKLTPVVRLAIENPNSSSNSQFGRGIANLCLGVRELGSLNAAAKDMGMAYSKAWRIVKDTEAALGIQLLVRDGAHGSELTDKGNLLLDAYLKMDNKLEQYAIKEFEKLFKA